MAIFCGQIFFDLKNSINHQISGDLGVSTTIVAAAVATAFRVLY
jgi:hypothetical protein